MPSSTAPACVSVLLILTLLVGAHAFVSTISDLCPSFDGDLCGPGHCVQLQEGLAACSCPSGRGGADCSVFVGAVCDGHYENPDALESDHTPTLVTAEYSSDMLTVVVDSPLVAQREYTTVWVDHSVEAHASCGYPGHHWSREFDTTNCHDIYTGIMPWAEQTAKCGWEYDDSNPDYYVYNADLIIQHHDFIDPFAGRGGPALERLTQHIIPLEVSFMRSVDVSTRVSVMSDMQLLALITKQMVDPEHHVALIEVTTNMLYPYRLDVNNMWLDPPDNPNFADYTYHVTETGEPSLCPDDPEQACTQQFTILIDAFSGCEVSGEYALTWEVICQVEENCLSSPGDTSMIHLNILSENFCAEVSVQVDIEGVLDSYMDDEYSVRRDAFKLDTVTYYKAQIFSPDANVVKTTLRSAKLVNANDPTDVHVLYSDGSLLLPDAQFKVEEGGAHYAHFNFILRSSYLGYVAPTASAPYTVVARLDVVFEGQPGSTSKRVVLADNVNHKPFGISSHIDVSGNADSIENHGEYHELTDAEADGVTFIESSASLVGSAASVASLLLACLALSVRH